MAVRVLLFAMLAEAAGRREIPWELPAEPPALEGPSPGAGAREPYTPRRLWRELYDRHLRESLPPVTAEHLRVAVNRRYAGWDLPLKDGDEVAFIPPVAGGQPGGDGVRPAPPGPVAHIEVTEQRLSADAALAAVVNPYAGGVCIFVGTVREFTEGRRTVHLEYEAYRAMAESEMRAIAEEVARRWPGARTALWHRVGLLASQEASVVIAVATAHRKDAFEACRFAIDRLKETVPIWKRERWADGTEEWVGPAAG